MNSRQHPQTRKRKADAATEMDLIETEEACRLLRVHRNTLYSLIRSGDIPAFRLVRGGRWRFNRSELVEWIDAKQARRMLG